jgi:hypothetical protein
LSFDQRLCYSFRNLAGRVWRERGAATRLGMPWNEESVTEWLLLQLAKKHQAPNFQIRAYTRPQEKLNGADWEFRFADNKFGVSLRIQAKRLFPSGRYESLFKPSGNKFEQLDKLTSNAGAAYPLYVFYNHAPAFPNFIFSVPPDCGNRSFRARSYWGCSVAKPAFVKQVGSDSTGSLVDGMMPWHCLVCHCPICRGGRCGSPTLPFKVAATLNFLPVGRERLPIEDAEGKISPDEQQPYWVRLIEIVRQSDVSYDAETEIDRYLEKNELAGVALIKENKEAEVD